MFEELEKNGSSILRHEIVPSTGQIELVMILGAWLKAAWHFISGWSTLWD